MPLPGETGEVWTIDTSNPPGGQAVPTPDAPITAPLPPGPRGDYPPAPIVPVVNGGGNGSIDPQADRVCAWWMNRKQADMWGPSLGVQFAVNGPLYNANQWSLQNFNQPFYMPSTALSWWQGVGFVWRLIGATLAYKLPPMGNKMGARIAWGVGGFLFPTLATGAVALRQVTK